MTFIIKVEYTYLKNNSLANLLLKFIFEDGMSYLFIYLFIGHC